MVLTDIITATDDYNLHSHTQFCDGRATMELMARAAVDAGMKVYGFSPHSTVPVASGCNMSRESVAAYLDEADRLRDIHMANLLLLTSMEIDYIDADWGPHHDYFQRLPLHYRIGSVHFVPTQDDDVPVDCDGRFERFSRNLRDVFHGDLRYVVERYFEQVLLMQERGGFDLLAHFDKIAGNASQADPAIENQHWYEALVDDVIDHAAVSGTVVEINTKAYDTTGRFYPAERWWPRLMTAGIPLAVDSDAHYPDRILSGRAEALKRLARISESAHPHKTHFTDTHDSQRLRVENSLKP